MCNQPAASLSAASATGPGEVIDLGGSMSLHTMVRTAAGGPTDMNVDMEGSHDGASWFTLASLTNSTAAPQAVTSERVVRYVRANLLSLTGGASPTVTATIASAAR